MTRPINRRTFLQRLGVGMATPYLLLASDSWGRSDAGADRRWFRFLPRAAPELVFGFSVASGDPTPSGVMLWTRINPRAWRADRPLAFEVATDSAFRGVVARGLVQPSDFGPETDFTVRVDLDGRLQPNRYYYYRFIYRSVASRTGRCRTLPPPGAALDRVRFGVVTCQDFANGYYGAFDHLARDPNIDYVLHLGDFIYEGAADPSRQTLPYPDRFLVLPSGQPVAVDLADYRYLYQRYRSDRFHQQVMEQHTWIVIWDDHETANDTYWDYDRDTLGAPDHPFTTDPANGNDPARLRRLKRDAMQAWAEYVPARLVRNESATHPHDYYTMFRSFVFGDLVHLFMLDERTYRTPHPCGEGGFGERQVTTGCPARTDEAGSMLGDTQAAWLVDGITRSSAMWKVLGNQVLFSELAIGNPESGRYFLSLDSWDGYEAERRWMLQQFKAAGVGNLVWLTGDLHTYLASYVKLDYRITDHGDPENTLGVEFMTPAVTSSNFAEIAAGLVASADPRKEAIRQTPPSYLLEPAVRAANPHIQFFNSQDWGYSTVEFNRWYCEYTAYNVDKTVNRPDAPRSVLRRLRVPRGWVRMLDVAT